MVMTEAVEVVPPVQLYEVNGDEPIADKVELCPEHTAVGPATEREYTDVTTDAHGAGTGVKRYISLVAVQLFVPLLPGTGKPGLPPALTIPIVVLYELVGSGFV